MRLELTLLVVFMAAWVASLASVAFGRPWGDNLDLGLYGLYGFAVASGWLAGNVYVQRARGALRPLRRLLFWVYFLGPPALGFLAWSLAPLAEQARVPLAPVYAYGVFAVFFLVPVTFSRSAPRNPS